MNTISIIVLAIGLLTFFISCFIIFYQNLKTRKTLESCNQMLNLALQKDFSEKTFDESLLSAFEAKLANYLTVSCVSAKNLTAEKNKIKELIADIAHQTKTPIANVMLYSQLLAETNLPPESRAYVSELITQSKKLDFLILSLIKTSRLESGIIALLPIVQNVFPMLERAVMQICPKALEKEISISLNPSSDSALFDAKWTAEAIYNILDNAVKYTPSKGTITISIISYDLFCRIDISDNGIGISEEEHSKIFSRFYRSPMVSAQEGVGIGLYLSRQIISEEGGYIKLSSAIGKGSIFSIFLQKKP